MNFKSRAWASGLLTVAIAVVAVVVANAQKDQRTEPLPSYFFSVEVGGQSIGHFKSVTGLKIETEVIDYQEGGSTGSIRKLAGATRYANLRLTRRFTGDRSLYDRFVNTQKPNPVRVDGRIIMFDNHGTRLGTWEWVNGFPVKWQGPELDAAKNEVALETIEIAHEGLTWSEEEN
jgi:phage tail-like protein